MNSEMDGSLLAICVSDALPHIAFRSHDWACWLHIATLTWSSCDSVVTNLALGGCGLIYVTGLSAKQWHETIDDCLIRLGREDVLTAYGEQDDGDEQDFADCVEEFCDITRGYAKIRLFASVGDRFEDEQRYWSLLLSLTEKCSK